MFGLEDTEKLQKRYEVNFYFERDKDLKAAAKMIHHEGFLAENNGNIKEPLLSTLITGKDESGEILYISPYYIREITASQRFDLNKSDLMNFESFERRHKRIEKIIDRS